MKPTRDVSVIVPQFNRPQLTSGCLRSLLQHERGDVELIVVDDGSTPESLRAIEAESIPGLRLIGQSRAGVTAAWNRGARCARSPYLVFLNNDTLFRGPALGGLLAPLKEGRALLSGVLMRRENHLPTETRDRLPSDRFLQGWCFAVSRGDFERVGGFDEAMRLYWSDTDFQSRVLRSHGTGQDAFGVRPELPLVHLAHRTARDLDDRHSIWRSDRAAFISKWGPA